MTVRNYYKVNTNYFLITLVTYLVNLVNGVLVKHALRTSGRF